jgi:hypothetical protein
MNTSCKERECLEQALDVRVFTAIRLQQQAAGDARILLRKLASEFAQVRQFPFVVLQEFFAHRAYFTVYSPLLNSSTVSKEISSGAGLIRISPWI